MHETVIYPQQSLFLVDRSFSTNGEQGNSLGRDGTRVILPSHSASRDVYRDTPPSNVPARKSCRPKNRKFRVRFVRPGVTTARETTLPLPLAGTDAISPHSEPGHKGDEKVDTRGGDMPLQVPNSHCVDNSAFSLVPGSSNTLYGRMAANMNPEAADLLHYYSVKIGRSFYPLDQTAVRFEFNPVGTVWLPVAIMDQVLLNAILLSAALRAVSNAKTHSTSQYLLETLQLVNERIANGTTNDATIGAVSCLVMIEHSLGDQQRSSIHRKGMHDMIVGRGGVETVDDRLLMKIYRAELHLCVDRLLQPILPRLRRQVPPLHIRGATTLARSNKEPWKLFLGLQPELSDVMSRLCELSRVLQYSADYNHSINPRAFDEDVICIQHDLLSALESTLPALSRACALAGLVYTKTLTREIPFDGSQSLIIAETMKDAFCKAYPEGVPDATVLWIHVMAAIAASNTNDSAWFRKKLRAFRDTMGLRTWHGAEFWLQKVAWIRQVHSTYGQDLWAKMTVEG